MKTFTIWKRRGNCRLDGKRQAVNYAKCYYIKSRISETQATGKGLSKINEAFFWICYSSPCRRSGRRFSQVFVFQNKKMKLKPLRQDLVKFLKMLMHLTSNWTSRKSSNTWTKLKYIAKPCRKRDLRHHKNIFTENAKMPFLRALLGVKCIRALNYIINVKRCVYQRKKGSLMDDNDRCNAWQSPLRW